MCVKYAFKHCYSFIIRLSIVMIGVYIILEGDYISLYVHEVV